MMDISEYAVTSSELEFLAKKERDGDLVSSISSEFSGNGDQITITPASGKTFYLVGARLYPVTNTTYATTTSDTARVNRGCDVELTFNSTVKDVLTYDFEQADVAGNQTASNSGQLSTLAKGISMAGDGAKTVKLTSSNTSGTYRVSLLGYYEAT